MNEDDCATETDCDHLSLEVERLRSEIERHARVDYWAERYRDQQRELERLKSQHVANLNMIATLTRERDQWKRRAEERQHE